MPQRDASSAHASDTDLTWAPRGSGIGNTRAGESGSISRLATLTLCADVAELVDAHGSGPCGLRLVEVQVLSSA